MSTASIPASTDILTTTSCAPPAPHLLPWVEKIVHLGNIITNKVDMLAFDMDAKKERYVGRNIEINHEIFFAANKTKIKINNIFNSYLYYGTTLVQPHYKSRVLITESWKLPWNSIVYCGGGRGVGSFLFYLLLALKSLAIEVSIHLKKKLKKKSYTKGDNTQQTHKHIMTFIDLISQGANSVKAPLKCDDKHLYYLNLNKRNRNGVAVFPSVLEGLIVNN